MRIVILAGGSGTRLWPISRQNRPKQFAKLISEKTMLDETLARFSSFPRDKVFISTTRELYPDIKKMLPNFPEENIIAEPSKRDTAPAMGFVAAKLSLIDPDEPMIFSASDNYVGQNEKFINTVKQAGEVVKETGKFVNISAAPTFPNTNFGYIRIGKKEFEREDVEFYEFLGHVEKPDYKTAQQYLEEGNYFWNANYCTWTPALFLKAYEKYAPEIFEKLEEIKKLLSEGKTGLDPEIEEIYNQMEKISIDYAISEKMDQKDVLIIKGDFSWNDIGAWNTLHDVLMTKTDERRNLVKGERLNIDTSGCLIYGRDDKMIATIGLDDMVIVDTDDALLVCPKSRSHDVKKVIEELKERGERFV